VNIQHNNNKKRKTVPSLSVFGLHMAKLKSKAGLLSTCMRARSGQSDWRRKQTTSTSKLH